MIVYADILVIVNMIVDYFLLLGALRLVKREVKPYRLLLGALIGGLGSLIIFLPRVPLFLQIVFHILLCGGMTATVFGLSSVFSFLRSLVLILAVTWGYGGVMTAIWYLFHPNGMTVIGSVVYFDISPFLLVGATVVFYLLFTLFSYCFKGKAATARYCVVTLKSGEKEITVKGLLDTGNSVEDIFGGGEVLIGEEKCVCALFGREPQKNRELANRYRVIPCGTVSGGGLLDAFRCDTATVRAGQRSVDLKNPLLAISKVPIGEEVSVIVNPEIFTRGG